MRFTPWQSWHGIFHHSMSPHVRRVSLASPRLLTSPHRGSVSRRAFMQGTAGAAGLALAAAHRTPAQAEHTDHGKPLPIPTVRQTPFGPVREALDNGEPALITDFQGVVGAAELTLTGVGTDTTTDQTARYAFNMDVRFMQGEFIGADGQHHQGTFVFI